VKLSKEALNWLEKLRIQRHGLRKRPTGPTGEKKRLSKDITSKYDWGMGRGLCLDIGNPCERQAKGNIHTRKWQKSGRKKHPALYCLRCRNEPPTFEPSGGHQVLPNDGQTKSCSAIVPKTIASISNGCSCSQGAMVGTLDVPNEAFGFSAVIPDGRYDRSTTGQGSIHGLGWMDWRRVMNRSAARTKLQLRVDTLASSGQNAGSWMGRAIVYTQEAIDDSNRLHGRQFNPWRYGGRGKWRTRGPFQKLSAGWSGATRRSRGSPTGAYPSPCQ